MSELIVSAASSLTEALTELARQAPGMTVRLNFASSGALLQQIRQGAPVDVFISASTRELDTLEREQRLEKATRVTVASNRLVLIAPQGSMLRRWEELASGLVTRVALSQPSSVPSGRYAKETLQRRKLWRAVEPKAVYGESVRQTLAYVAGSNVEAGLVFATDARAEKRVRIIATAQPGLDHSPILYPAAVLTGAPNPTVARRFVLFLQSKAAQALFARFGFTAPGR